MQEKLRQQLSTRLQQKLNPMQVRFGRILEMSTPEVEDEVRRELDENPALMEISPGSDLPEENESGENFTESAEELQMADYGSDDDIPPAYRLTANNSSPDDPHYDYNIVSDDEESMFATLTERLSDFDLDDSELKIASYIIGNLDSNGYLTRSLESIADDISIAEGFTPDDGAMRQAFDAVRSLDPAGVGATDLRDCLLLQLQRLDTSLAVLTAKEIIGNNFDLFSKKHFDKLRARLGISADTLQEALDLIRTLNPKPGALLDNSRSSDRMRHIVPDFNVEYDDATGTFNVAILSHIPELGIEETFVPSPPNDKTGTTPRQREAQAFIRRKHDEATGFINMLRMRADTLMSVMKAVVKLQDDFFRTGDKARLRPMILKDVATLTGLDLSVISRASTSKYVLTPHGIYPLKFFFSERPKVDNDTSTHAILQAISSLIESEDKSHPLSDETIKDLLAAKGYDIARRTVAKYRERLGLPVARLRKQF